MKADNAVNFGKKRKKNTYTKEKSVKNYGDSASFNYMEKKWYIYIIYYNGTSTSHTERSRRPTEVATPETMNKIR